MPAPPLPPTYKPRPGKAPFLEKPVRRIFICDDDLDFATELANGLAIYGFKAKTLMDDGSTIDLFETFRPDMMLLDIYMPPPDGFEVMSHIANDTRPRDVSLILASGAEDAMLDVARQYCAARGIKPAAALKKPVRLSEILAVCRAHRDRQQPAAG